MTEQSTLTADDYRNFLLNIHFTGAGDDLKKCIRSGYFDFQRTLRGFGKFDDREQIKEEAFDYLYLAFNELRESKMPITQIAFDRWHQQICTNLIQVFKQYGWDEFYVGQAQKWVNMAFKYIYTFGETRLSGYQPVYAFCHIPIDNIILKQVKPYGFQGITNRWSRINSYEQYFQYQKWFRDTFDSIPLDAEFRLWQGQDIELR